MAEPSTPRTRTDSGPRGPGRTGPARRRETSRRWPTLASGAWKQFLLEPAAPPALATAILFVLALAAIAVWTRERYIPPAGRIMSDTALVQTEFERVDQAAIEMDREIARQRQPRVYVANQAVLTDIQSQLENLPVTVADAASLDAVTPEIRERFALTEPALSALRTIASNPNEMSKWTDAVHEFLEFLRARPILSVEDIQNQRLSRSETMELRSGAGAGDPPADESSVPRRHQDQAINAGSDRAVEEISRLARLAGFDRFSAPLDGAALGAATRPAIRPTFSYDEQATNELRDAEAAAVEVRSIKHLQGDVIVRRGDRLDEPRRALLIYSRAAAAATEPLDVAISRRLGLALSVAILAGGMVAYLFVFCRHIVDRPRRMIWLAAAILATTLLACAGAVFNAEYHVLLATSPTVFLAASLVIAFDRRVAMAIASIQAVLIAVALQQGPWLVLISITGAASAVWWLNNVRSRNVVLWAALWTGLGMGVAGLTAGLGSKPMVNGVWNDILLDALQAACGGLAVGFVVLLLPLIERAFDVVTPMRLIELRDPKQPLLREMAQRAPGSYTHSISVASIAEAAADAIGANGLHVYAGALYHDIGKMNKPEYFVENQSGGINPHEKLSPAMSLLVIVGHVKEGLELARENFLPRSIRHYIESHHGTTLVEYFFERARRQAGEADESEPFEFGYRYPGPKPQTREAAILMLADAVEGAARTLAEPTPSRIESLVHNIATKRLMDGQFDECDLTLRELHQIEKSIVKSLNSIYHARIAYPGQSDGARKRPAPVSMATRGVTA